MANIVGNFVGPVQRPIKCAVIDIPKSPSRIAVNISGNDMVLLSLAEATELCRHMAVAVRDLARK